MQITVFGASGRVGQLVVLLALERGHTVKAFVHSKNPFSDDADLEVITGEISDEAAVGKALQGSDAIISALGSWGTKSKDILTVGMRTIIPLAEGQGIQRLVSLTGSAALWSADKPGFIDKSGHLVLGLIAPKILRDGEAHLKLLEASKLDWTVVRSPVMNDKGGSAYHLDLQLSSVLANVSRQSVAYCLLDLAAGDDFVHQAPVIHRVAKAS
jgi:putative NADH-flavin reductase